MAGTISLSKVGNIGLKGGGQALTLLITKQFSKKLAQKDVRTYDFLHEKLKAHPKTKKIIGESAKFILDPANEYLAAMLYVLANTLANDESFRKSVTTSGSKHVTLSSSGKVSGIPKRVNTEPWPRLSVGYLRRVGALSNKNKRWWYERRRAGSRAPQGGKSLGEWAQSDIASLASQIQKGLTGAGTKATSFRSAKGVPNRFTISMSAKRRKARTHFRTSVKGKGYVVYGVSGDLVGPSRLTLGRGVASREFSNITIHSMMAEAAMSTGGAKAGAVYAGLNLLLENESKRPWIAKFFAKGGDGLVKHLHNSFRNGKSGFNL